MHSHYVWITSFWTELSVNRCHYGQFTPEARMYMKGVADGGASHSQIAEAVGTLSRR
jgi:hypothetical protein